MMEAAKESALQEKKWKLIYPNELSKDIRSSVLLNYEKQKEKDESLHPFFTVSDKELFNYIFSLIYHPACLEILCYLLEKSYQIRKSSAVEDPAKRFRLIICPYVCRTEISVGTGRSVAVVKNSIRKLKHRGILMSFQSRCRCNVYYIDVAVLNTFVRLYRVVIDHQKQTFKIREESIRYLMEYTEDKGSYYDVSYNDAADTL